VRNEMDELGIVVIESRDGDPVPSSTLDALEAEGIASSAQATGRAFALSTPTDPRYPEQWAFSNTGESGGIAGADIHAEQAWDWARGDDIVVAVVDEGVMFAHPDLAGQQWINTDEVPGNGVDDDGNGYV